MSNLSAFFRVADFEGPAREKISAMAWEHLSGAAGDELTLRWNTEAFDRLQLLPRFLTDVSVLDTRVSLLGLELPYPILLDPVGYHKLYHPLGEIETARGAALAETVFCVSTMTNTTIEDIAAAQLDNGKKAPLWYQLYVQKDRSFTKSIIERAIAAGCKALIVTVDTPVLGNRLRETRAGFQLPPGLERAMLRDVPEAAGVTGHQSDHGIYYPLTNPAMTWKDMEWIVSVSSVPVILKGIMTPEDAELAVKSGVHGIIVSNHGARNLDTVPATIDMLPLIAERIGGRIPILFDGGIRRGTDVLKALALGARAVLVGRPYIWALAVGGAEGVAKCLELLVTEFKMAMALTGARSLSEIKPDLVRRGFN